MGALVMVLFRLLTVTILLLPAVHCDAANSVAQLAASQFDQANKLYEQGKFAEAASAYEALVASNARSASVWFNLGNAAYKSGQLGRAIVAYRMAEQLTPRDSALRANLQFVRGKVYSDERTRVPVWKTAVRLATVNEWTVVTVACLWAFFSVLACAELVGRRYTKTASVFAVVALLSGAALSAAWQDKSGADAVVVAKEATSRFGPLDESQSAFQLRDGMELTVLDVKGDWLQVRDAEKRTGWIRLDEVAVFSMPYSR